MRDITRIGEELHKQHFSQIHFFFIFFIPLLMMKSFSEEKRLNTMSLLELSKLSLTEITLGKFISHVILIYLFQLLTLPFSIILIRYDYISVSVLLTSFLGKK